MDTTPEALRARLAALIEAPPPPRLLVRPDPPDPGIAEAPFQALVVDVARWLGWLVYHPYDSRRSARGFPDLTLVRRAPPYTLVMAELKTERGRLTTEQCEWATALLRAGVRYHLWRPSNWHDILETLTAG
jgi:hypothetical protein